MTPMVRADPRPEAPTSGPISPGVNAIPAPAARVIAPTALATRFHWNDFFTPVTGHLTSNMKAIDDVAAGWDYLIGQLSRTHAEFAPLEGYSSVILFGPTGRAV
jgi:hypothetical protein